MTLWGIWLSRNSFIHLVLGLSVQWVGVDSCNVISLVKGADVDMSVNGCVISDIKALLNDVGVFKCHAIPRSGNGMAHSLASLSLSSFKDQL
ncbi:hypothetical protein ACOSQ2_010659 [Xanthoceras sorbifolium]